MNVRLVKLLSICKSELLIKYKKLISNTVAVVKNVLRGLNYC